MTSYTYTLTVTVPGPDDEEAGDVATTLADAISEPVRCYGWQVSPLELVVPNDTLADEYTRYGESLPGASEDD